MKERLMKYNKYIGLSGRLNPEKLRVKRGYDRHYIHPEKPASYYKSVTSVLGNTSKGGLPYWQLEQCILYLFDNPSSIVDVSDLSGQVQMNYAKELRREAINSRLATYKRDMGTELHTRMEYVLLGEKPPNVPNYLDKDIVDEWERQITEFIGREGFSVYGAEVVGYNHEDLYAGTLDAILEKDDIYYAVDFKTGNLYKEQGAQLVAYILCDDLMTNEAELIEMPSMTRALVIQPNIEQGLNVKSVDLVEAREIWDAALALEYSGNVLADYESNIHNDPA